VPEPEMLVAAELVMFACALPPLIVIPLVALSPNTFCVWPSTCTPFAVKPSVVPIFIALACMITFAFDVISMLPSDSILISLFAESMTILFFLVLSTIVIFSAPCLSSKMMRWPQRDLISFVLFFAESLTSTGSCVLLHSAPTTIGRSTSPCSNTTSS
jgi:hypothetical protein